MPLSQSNYIQRSNCCSHFCVRMLGKLLEGWSVHLIGWRLNLNLPSSIVDLCLTYILCGIMPNRKSSIYTKHDVALLAVVLWKLSTCVLSAHAYIRSSSFLSEFDKIQLWNNSLRIPHCTTVSCYTLTWISIDWIWHPFFSIILIVTV
jgi:hypothetical protein